mmetsp:Transcript_15956/g.25888  ORF Transcript_15956/g.25888 Transcript_15956/m.25888 type:complete len:291 (+) Transcript_15956:202-1074(+)
MSRLFLKRSQATARDGTVVASSSHTNRFQNNNNSNNNHHRRRRDGRPANTKPVQGSEAVAVESQQINAKVFKYPEGGFETWIEHSLLYTMIRESDIFPAEAVLQAIDEEDYTQYFHVKDTTKQTSQATENNKNDDNTANDSSSSTLQVSYAQLTALLALAGEEWTAGTEVPERLCKAISKQIIKYAYQHDLDRQQELKELLDPLIAYANERGRKQSLQLLPWFAALTVSTVNPLAFYSTYMTMIMVNGETMGKRDRADRNTIDMMEQGNRHGNVEKASLLDEDHYNDFDD